MSKLDSTFFLLLFLVTLFCGFMVGYQHGHSKTICPSERIK